MDIIDEAPECDNPRSEFEDIQISLNDERKGDEVLQKNFQLAATYIEDARVGRHSDFRASGMSLRLYHMYYHPIAEGLMVGLITFHALLALFEEPAVKGLELSWHLTVVFECFILIGYSIRTVHLRSFQPATHFFSDTKTMFFIVLILILDAALENTGFPPTKLQSWGKCKFFSASLLTVEWMATYCTAIIVNSLLVFNEYEGDIFLTDLLFITAKLQLCLLDIIIFIGLTASGIKCIRWSRPLRPIFAINLPEMRQLRRSFRNMRRTLPDVFSVLILLFFSLAIFALMAFKLFGGRNMLLINGRPYFNTYWNSIFDLYVLVTTANNPDIMMPAFDANQWYVVFFVVFLVLCFFIYMNIILAVIYNNYRRHLKNEVKKSILTKRLQLSKAFDLLYTHLGCRKVLSRGRFNELMASLPQRRTDSLIQVLWIVLDTDNASVISKTEFLKLADLLNVEVREVFNEKPFIGMKFPHIYDSRLSVLLRKLARNRFFRYFFDFLTVLNAVVIGFSKPDSNWDSGVEWCFLSLFMMEIMIKLYALGGRKFRNRLWNVFDLVVIGSAFFLAVIEQISQGVKESRLSLDVLLVLRVLRLVKVIGSVHRFKIIIDTINKILPSLLNYGSVILVIYYMFAVTGMELFGGTVRYMGYRDENFCGNLKLNGTEFWREKYCNNNFNDLIHALIVLFELTVVNQWQVIAYGYAAVTSPAARLFFMTFHLVCVIVVLNIFTAFVLEVFMLEYCSRKGFLENEVESKIHEMGLSTKSERQRRASTVSNQDLVDREWESSDEDEKPNCKDFTDLDGSSRRRRESSRESFSNRYKETNVRFHISKKIRSVEVLLQKMFERELSEEIELTTNELNQWASEEGSDLFGKNLWSLP